MKKAHELDGVQMSSITEESRDDSKDDGDLGFDMKDQMADASEAIGWHKLTS